MTKNKTLPFQCSLQVSLFRFQPIAPWSPSVPSAFAELGPDSLLHRKIFEVEKKSAGKQKATSVQYCFLMGMMLLPKR